MERAPGNRWYPWVALVALMVPTLLMETGASVVGFYTHSLEHSLHLRDVAFSGVAFAAPSIGAALAIWPAGWLADARRRVPIVIAGLVFESICVLGMVASHDALGFAIARLGMGAGAVIGVPATISLIADYFPSTRRAFAVAMYGAVALGGSGLATAVSGFLVAAIRTAWPLAFALIAAAALIVAFVLAFVLREPIRRDVSLGVQAASLGAFVRYCGSSWRFWTGLFGALWIFDISYMALSSWSAPLLLRLGEHPAHVGIVLGATRTVAGIFGALLGGAIGQSVHNSGRFITTLRFIAITFACACVGALLMWPVREGPFVVTVGIFIAATGVGASLMNVALQDVLDNRMRGRMLATHSFFAALIGTLGPTLAAVFSEHLFTGPHALWSAVALLAFCASGVAAAVMAFSSRSRSVALSVRTSSL